MTTPTSHEKVNGMWVRYWRSYGGGASLLVSRYLYLAVVLTLLTAGNWTTDAWWESVTSVLPNVLGFTLGGFAILVSFGDERFKAILAEGKLNGDPSTYLKISAGFMHFIVVQVLALSIALIAKSAYVLDLRWVRHWAGGRPTWLFVIELGGSFVGYLLFMYSITTALAAGMSVFRLSFYFERYSVAKSRKDQSKAKPSEGDGPHTANGPQIPTHHN